jgi:hypothetical protein
MSMSGSGDKPLEIQSLTVFPRGDQHHTGVVFYRLFSDELSAANVRELLATIAEIYAQNGPFVVRYGFRKEGEDQFWVGLNHSSCGTTFEGMLRALARGRRIRVSRAFHLPGDNPNPELKPVLPVDQVVRLHAKHNGNDVTNAASMVAPQPRRAEPAEPVVKMGPFDRMKAARQELSGTDIGQRFRRGRRGRRGREDQPEQQ